MCRRYAIPWLLSAHGQPTSQALHACSAPPLAAAATGHGRGLPAPQPSRERLGASGSCAYVEPEPGEGQLLLPPPRRRRDPPAPRRRAPVPTRARDALPTQQVCMDCEKLLIPFQPYWPVYILHSTYSCGPVAGMWVRAPLCPCSHLAANDMLPRRLTHPHPCPPQHVHL